MSGFYGANQSFDAGKTGMKGGSVKRKRLPKREHKLIAFKAFFDTDREILNWWEGMAEGERSDVIRSLLRGYLQGLPLYEAAQRKLIPVDGNTVKRLHDDTVWIREALADMPTYFEQLLGRMAFYSPPQSTTQSVEILSVAGGLSAEELARRKAKVGKTRW